MFIVGDVVSVQHAALKLVHRTWVAKVLTVFHHLIWSR